MIVSAMLLRINLRYQLRTHRQRSEDGRGADTHAWFLPLGVNIHPAVAAIAQIIAIQTTVMNELMVCVWGDGRCR